MNQFSYHRALPSEHSLKTEDLAQGLLQKIRHLCMCQAEKKQLTATRDFSRFAKATTVGFEITSILVSSYNLIIHRGAMKMCGEKIQWSLRMSVGRDEFGATFSDFMHLEQVMFMRNNLNFVKIIIFSNLN